MNTPTTRRVVIGALSALALLATACSDDDDSAATTAPAATTVAPDTAPPDTGMPETTMATETTEMAMMYEGELVGLFAITGGACADGTTTGSWFQMVQPGGTATDGPFVPNGDSACADTNYTLLSPGMDAGLRTDALQVAPDPAFDETGNGLAVDIFSPVPFFGVAFAGAMDPAATAPTVTAADGVLTADLSAFTAYYGGGMFSQGGEATGTIDPMTGEYVLEWTSLISGGSFDGFTGVWHLEGTFTPVG